MVTTIHGFSGAGILPAYAHARSTFVAISDSDRSDQTRLRRDDPSRHRPRRAAVPNTIQVDDLVVFGRIHPDKGTADAIEIARQAGRRLVICGIVQDERYFAEQVAAARRRRPGRLPRLGRPGAAGRGPRVARRCCCTRSTSTSRSGCRSSRRWRAAHRSSPIRAGSMAEVVDEGVTGYLADDLDSAVARGRRRGRRWTAMAVHARARATGSASSGWSSQYLRRLRAGCSPDCDRRSLRRTASSRRGARRGRRAATAIRASPMPYGNHSRPSCRNAPQE